MKNLSFKLIIAVLLLSSCTNTIFQDGELSPEQYLTTIDYELRQDLIVIQIPINGVIYDFLIDSGAITIVSDEVGKALNLEVEFSSDYEDSKDETFTIDFGHTDQLKIGEIAYAGIGIGKTDFSEVNSISCLNIDGIIGSNLMQKSIWQIDYENQEIHITDDINRLDISSEAQKIPFTADDKGEAYVDLTVSGEKVKDVEIDLGSSYDFRIPFNKLPTLNDGNKPAITGNGYGSAGFTGYADDDENVTIVFSDQIYLAGLEVKGAPVHLTEKGGAKVGNTFLSQYEVTIDWLAEELYLAPVNIRVPELLTYGFTPIYNEGRPRLGTIYNVDNPALEDLNPDDIITNVNGIDCTSISKEEWCMIEENLFTMSPEKLEITVQSNQETANLTLMRISLK